MRINITALMVIMCLIQVSAASLAQSLTLKGNQITLEKVFLEIRKQTGHDVFFEEGKLQIDQRINVNFNQTSLKEVMTILLDGTALKYTIENKSIVIKTKDKNILSSLVSMLNNIEISGMVLDERGIGKDGVTIKVKETNQVVYSDKGGRFLLKGVSEDATITFSFIGYTPFEEKAKVLAITRLVRLKLSDSPLDEVQVMAYGETSRRKATGNITKISGDDIRLAPVSNPMVTLQGLVPGLVVTETSGYPGSSVNLQIRGRTKVDGVLGADDSPLFIIDGVPLTNGSANITQLSSAIGGISPFNGISAGDIESIEVLKDADATAIYGSRGAAGVILISTKKAGSGPPKINLSLSSGVSKAFLPEMLNSEEFVMMREEAFKNDNLIKTNANAYDLLLWDTQRKNNNLKDILGANASYTDIQGSIAGGTERANFSLSSSYNSQRAPVPKAFPNTRGTIRFAANTISQNKKFSANFIGTYSFSRNQAPGVDPKMAIVRMAPYYKYYNEDGSIAWNQGDFYAADNPLSNLELAYDAKSSSIVGNVQMGYRFTDEFAFKVAAGLTQYNVKEVSSTPLIFYNPLMPGSPTNRSDFSTGSPQSWIAEPQLEYKKHIGAGRLTVLAGGSMQSDRNRTDRFSFSYTTDEYLGTMLGIRPNTTTNTNSASNEFKYIAGFARLSYELNDKYFLNLSARRDGSSRFGPGYRFGNFGAIGTSWIFSDESWFKKLNVLSFGKLRASYGVTGNDKIGDYKFLDLYQTSILFPGYNGLLAMSPTSLFRTDLHWEINKKLEVALDLGFLSDRFLFSAAYYRQRSLDALVNVPLPGTTGFANVASNLDGVIVQNSGLELTLQFNTAAVKDFNWKTSLNVTIPQNKLIAFPNLDRSTYARFYQVGKNLNMIYGLMFEQVDPQTGLPVYKDVNGSGKIENDIFPAGDRVTQFDSEQHFYGGMQNVFSYKAFSLTVMMNFQKAWMKNWMGVNGSIIGSASAGNMPKAVLARWQKPGDVTDFPKFSTRPYDGYDSSDVVYTNLFYGSIRNINLSYTVPTPVIKKIGLKALTVYCSAQNLFYFVPFGGKDPESFNRSRLTPLRTTVAGLNVSL